LRKKQVFTLQPCIHVWGTPLGSSSKAILQDASLILIMKNENPHKEPSGGFERLATALMYRHESQEAGKTIVRCDLLVAKDTIDKRSPV
jgi:hypothetical protein